MRDFYSQVTVADIQDIIGTDSFNQLNSSAKAALEVLDYNASNDFLFNENGDPGNIVTDLQQQNYAAAAYELAFNTAKPGNTAYEDRSLVGAALMLGFNVGIDGSNSINSLTPTGNVSSQAVVNFLQLMMENNPTSYLSDRARSAFP